MNFAKLRKSKKGFTIIELVIVIAVIAILAAVLIPTFSNVITNANKSSAMQSAKSAYTTLVASDPTKTAADYSGYVIKSVKSSTWYFVINAEGQMDTVGRTSDPGHHAATATTLAGTPTGVTIYAYAA